MKSEAASKIPSMTPARECGRVLNLMDLIAARVLNVIDPKFFVRKQIYSYSENIHNFESYYGNQKMIGIIMKTRSLIVAAAVALIAVSCSPKVSDKTTITGDLGANAPESVELSIKDANVLINVPVTDGKFTAEIPACQTGIARIKVGNLVNNFVSDGTPLNVTMTDGMTLNITSKYPKISTPAAYEILQKGLLDLQKNYQPKIQAAVSEEMQNSVYDAYQKDVKKICLEALNLNKDNYVTVSAIENLQYLLGNEQMDSVLSIVDPKIAEIASVKAISEVVEAKKATAEGMKFTDFEVDGVKFSDFVGNGKYMLVDFWASWCGPCKAELPNIKKVYETYAGPEFDVLSVAVWDKKEDTIKGAKDLGIVWNQIIDAQNIPTDIYGIQGIPHIILFGPDGTIVKRDLRGSAIEAEVAKYVKPVK